MRYTLLALLGGMGAWWALALWTGPLLLPSPPEVLTAAVENTERLLQGTVYTSLATIGALGIATFLGVAAAILAWWSPEASRAILPYTVLVQVVPIVAIAPLLVVWLGYGTGVATVTGAIAAFFPVYSACATGLRAPSQELVDLFALYRASRAAELRWLRLPAALPVLLSGLRTAGGLAVIGAIVGEFVGSNGFPVSLGYLVVYAARSANLGLCFAAIFAAALLALLLHAGIGAIERGAVGRWYGR
ncbi:MAG: ABC transporter permease subunit [Deltaproteobacteria bacterium]|nr:ABC transporter permease subunit [Deltaproteobacteria bacterium]